MQRTGLFISWGVIITALPAVVLAQSQFLLFDQPYVPFLIPSVETSQWFYSELQNFPEMYQFDLMATSTFSVQIMAVDHTSRAPGLSGILVKDDSTGGVREIRRFLANSADWAVVRERRTQMQYKQGPQMAQELGPGTYRLEISTPDNQGRYSLRIGEERPTVGYFASLGEIRSIQAFHGFSWWHMFRTSHVYVPILILVILVGVVSTLYYARRQRML